MPFPSLQGSRTGLFSGLSAGDSCPLRIPLDKLGAAVSPTSKPRKDTVLPPVTPEKVSSLSVPGEFFKDPSSFESLTIVLTLLHMEMQSFLTSCGARAGLNPEHYGNSNLECSKHVLRFGHLEFEFVSSLCIRISDFVSGFGLA